MCGIAGILNPFPGATSEELLLKMISIQGHRGPDETGLYIDDMIGLGHSRLSIVGLSGGTQPLCNEDGSLWIVFNGEIFNHLELRAELLNRGHRFSTSTDTEVILHLFEEFGVACLQQLNGQFAFALWDSERKELTLARDRVGIRPLFITSCKGRLLFASEIKALFMDPEVQKSIDLKSLQQVFTFWAPVESRTIFQDVQQLPPGHYQVVRYGETPGKPIPYWSLPCHESLTPWLGSREEAIEQIRFLLTDSVRLRLRADVPVGAYLSGGLDSSILTSIIAKKFNNRLKTFSLGFEEHEFDESIYQRLMSEELGTEHHQVTVRNEDIRDHFAKVIWHCESPLLRTGPVPLYKLAALVRDNGFKVVLTGEGADEVFGGYNIFKEAKVRDFWSRNPDSSLRPQLVRRLYPYLFDHSKQAPIFLQQFFSVSANDRYDPLFSHRKRWGTTGKCRLFFSREVLGELEGVDPSQQVMSLLPSSFMNMDALGKAQWLEMKIFLSNYLLSSQGDRVAMANSIELRLPYLDHRLIEFVARLPGHWKMPGLKEKQLLKAGWRGEIPESIIQRPKQPYRAPAAQAFSGGKSTDFRDLVCLEQVKRVGVFDAAKVENLLTRRASGGQAVSEVLNMALTGILSMQLLYEQFIGPADRYVVPVRPDKVVKRDCLTDGSTITDTRSHSFQRPGRDHEDYRFFQG